MSFGWVKAYNELYANEKAYRLIKEGTNVYPDDSQITEGGLKHA